MNDIDQQIKDFEVFLKRSSPSLDKFERAAILNHLRDALPQAQQSERESWLNQPANQHDARIRQAERAAILALRPEINELVAGYTFKMLDEWQRRIEARNTTS